ncbi:MAG: hypothetical protein LBJ67_15695, partial [Planctomycetaceae bacterium]|nr:hypothetical protein [Planctomycetaceae bacterium]
ADTTASQRFGFGCRPKTFLTFVKKTGNTIVFIPNVAYNIVLHARIISCLLGMGKVVFDRLFMHGYLEQPMITVLMKKKFTA